MSSDRRNGWTDEPEYIEIKKKMDEKRKEDHIISVEFWCAKCQRCRPVPFGNVNIYSCTDGTLAFVGARCPCGNKLDITYNPLKENV